MFSFNQAKFANTVLYLLRGCGEARPGLVKLMKMLKAADFEHYRRYLRPITGASYVALENGPAPDGYDKLLQDLIDANAIELKTVNVYGTAPDREYRALEEPNERVFDESEIEILNEVVASCRAKSGKTLSKASHLEGGWAWAWDPHRPGSPIPYTLVRWLENLCDRKDLAQAAAALAEPETTAFIALLRAQA